MATIEPGDADLPKALLKRLIKAKLTEVDASSGGDGKRDFQVSKEALLAHGEAGKLFIHYLTATANDVCKDAKRQTISADDVLTALNDLDFGELIDPIKESLEAFKVETREKNKKKTDATKKRKAGTEPTAEAEGEAAEAEEHDDADAMEEDKEGEQQEQE